LAPSLASLAAARLAEAKREAAKKGTPLAAFAARYGEDFYGFCHLLEVKVKAASGEARVPFRLTKIQRIYCENRSPRDVILKARQVKITTIELARDVWFFLTKPGVGVRVICQSSTDHSMLNDLSDRIQVFFDALKRSANLALDFTVATRSEWRLPNGSSLKIVEAGASQAAAQKKVRGENVHRVHTTEIAFWEYAGQTLNAMNEAIAGPEQGTEIVHESTPNGVGSEERGSAKDASGGAYFFWLCQDARRAINGYQFHLFSWLQNDEEYALPLDPGEVIEPQSDRERDLMAAGATPEQIKWYRRKVREKGQDDTDQEYASDPETCFLVSGRQVFERAITEHLITSAKDPIGTIEIARSGAVGTCRIWAFPQAGQRYVLAADTSEGGGGDRGGGQVYEYGTGRHMATILGQFKPGELARDLDCLGCWYNTALLAVERNNHGHACLQELERIKYPNVFHDGDGKPGWNTTVASRPAAIDALEQAHRAGQWTTLDRDVLGEFRTFVVSKSGKAEAAKGARDDLVMMAVIGWDVLRRLPPPARKPPPPRVQHFDSMGIGFG
jgi:hypothetical protein